MATEIERKFLVERTLWHPVGEGVRMLQGYLSTEPERTVRVRIAGERAYLTIKGKNQGIRRAEFEYAIPVDDAEALMELCERPPIVKRRHIENCGGFTWEIDVFEGENAGLVVAEIELPSEETRFPLPEWAGQEVSGDERYYNSSLQENPYSTWKS